MKEISVETITQTIKELVIKSATELPDDVLAAFEKGREIEESPIGKRVMEHLIENAMIAKRDNVPVCQDTGMAMIFFEIGQDVHITGGDFKKAVEEGVREGYRDGYLRKSTLDPIERENFGDNTPPIIHTEIVPGDSLRIIVMTKGFGGENMSKVQLFPPAFGLEGAMDEVVKIVSAAGPNSCPPVIVGVGIGGNLEHAALIAKKALMRKTGEKNRNPKIAAMEKDLLERINRLGIGPAGLGGRVTCLAVHIETYPTHIASIPLAVNIQCNAHRHKETVL